jgi:tRNA dimethylallyltransferase
VKPIFLLGPTAVGKTEVSLELARRIGGEVVSADSMQIYRGMNIGTAKPSLAERKGIPHHLMDVMEIDQHCDVAQFQALATAAIHEIILRGAQPIVVGGSGLYLRVLTRGLFEGPGRDEALRGELEKLETSALYQRVREVDPTAAEKIESRDRKRLIRALECFMLTGKPISVFQTQWKEDAVKSPKSCLIGLTRSREDLYRRCDQRVDRMFQQGFVEEVANLMKLGLATTPTACKAIGYPDAMKLVLGQISLEEAIQLIKRRTRNFVKRQLTWFRQEPNILWIEVLESETTPMIVSRIEAALKNLLAE